MTESSGLEFGPARHGGDDTFSSGASYLLFAREMDSWERSSEGIDQAYRSWGQLDQQKRRAAQAARSLDAANNGDSSLFSSSLPALFKNQLTMDNLGPRETSVDEELFGSLEDMESQTIGNLLPDDEEELFAGIRDQVLAETAEDSEDLDLFSSGGGLELDADGQALPGEFFQQGFNHAPTAGEHPFGEHPSRTLFVRNINSNVEDTELRALFEKYGDIRTLYTACKHRGFVMISYYDIRSARLALRSLQGKPLRRRKLDIHFSIPKDNPSDKDMNQGTLVVFNLDASVSNDDLLQIFGAYGEIKEIRETPHKRHHKFIEFFDVRAAEAALRGLNRTDIAGKRIKLEPSRPGGARKSLMQQHGRELDPEDSFHPRTAWTNSPPGPSCDLRSALEADSSFLSPNSTMYRPFSPRVSGQLHDLSRGGFAEGQSRPLRSHVLDQQGGLHPHSLPDFSLLGKGQPYKAAVTSFARPVDGLETRGITRATSLKEDSFPHLNGALQRSASLSGQPGLWGAGPYGQGTKMLWQNMSPGQTYADSLFSSGFSQLGSYSRELSADRHQSYVGDTQELPAYVPSASFGSLRVNGLNGGHMDHGSPSPSLGMYLQHRMLPNGGSSFDERRNRRTDSGLFAQADNKKQFQLDIDRILSGDDTRTTLMIKNIPNKYTSKMLLAAIDEYHQGTYDFVYLPIDFKNKCNVGYAFINMLSPSLVIPFYQTFNGKKWEKFNSEKVASLAYARIQGKPALIAHFQNSSLMNEDKRCRPIIFHGDGPNAGDQEPFPAATDLSRARLGRFANGSEDYANGSVDAVVS